MCNIYGFTIGGHIRMISIGTVYTREQYVYVRLWYTLRKFTVWSHQHSDQILKQGPKITRTRSHSWRFHSYRNGKNSLTQYNILVFVLRHLLSRTEFNGRAKARLVCFPRPSGKELKIQNFTTPYHLFSFWWKRWQASSCIAWW